MLLLIDFREKKILELLKYNKENECVTTTVGTNIHIKYKVVNLEIGDFVIKNEDTNETILVVERKSVKDLCASIMDGRFRQQKERLLDSVGNCEKVLYIIEGNKKTVQPGINRCIIDSSIVNLVFRHKYKVLSTIDESDTLDNIALLYKKIEMNEFEEGAKAITAPIKLLSKKDKIKTNMMAIQLSAIPGVSFASALKISELYPNMKSLIDGYNNCENESNKMDLLSSIVVNGKRKIGRALSKKVYNAITSTQDYSESNVSQ
jgi:crossover junction endonuclease MUS81